MALNQINNVADLKNEVLDKPTTKLSQKEINVLNSISKDVYKDMKDQLEQQTFDLQDTDGIDIKWVSLKDIVENIDTQKNISIVNWKEIKIGRWTELGSWIQIYLISHPELSVSMSDQAKGEYLGIDGKIGRFTKQALDELKGRIIVEAKAKKETENQIDELKDGRLINWITAQLNEALIKSGVNKNVEVSITWKEISISSYNTVSKINLENGTISIPGDNKWGMVDFPERFEFLLDKDQKINIEESDENNSKLQQMLLLSNFLNFTIDKFIKPQKWKNKKPFVRRTGANSTLLASPWWWASSGLHFNDSILFDTDVLSDENMRKIGLKKMDFDFLNEIYNNYSEKKETKEIDNKEELKNKISELQKQIDDLQKQI